MMVDLRPWGELNCEKINNADVMVMGVPFDGAVSCGKGAALAPEKLRSLSRYLPTITEEGNEIENLRIYDHGDVAFSLNWSEYYSEVEKEALSLLKTGKFCLFIGGDHSVTIPLSRAYGQYYKGKKIGIIHFDSHPDLCNEYDGHKWSHACPFRRAVEDVLTPADLAQVGIRSYESEEVAFYKSNPGLLLIRACDVYREGWLAACQKLKAKFKNYDAVYISLDIDVLDPAFAPGTGTPEAGGLSTRELMEIIRFLMDELPIVAMDLVEVSPPLDSVNNITSWAALKVLYEVFGKLSKNRK
ncbi:MAG: agmatinase [Eubacteriales bacterium]